MSFILLYSNPNPQDGKKFLLILCEFILTVACQNCLPFCGFFRQFLQHYRAKTWWIWASYSVHISFSPILKGFNIWYENPPNSEILQF